MTVRRIACDETIRRNYLTFSCRCQWAAPPPYCYCCCCHDSNLHHVMYSTGLLYGCVASICDFCPRLLFSEIVNVEQMDRPLPRNRTTNTSSQGGGACRWE